MHHRKGIRQPVLEFWYTGNGSATFDPGLTTSKATTIVWQTSDGQRAVTTGTTHNFSYTPASGGPYRCVVRVAGGLGLVTGIDANTDSLTALKNVARTKVTSYNVRDNVSLISFLCDIPYATAITAYSTIFEGSLAQINRSATYIWLTASVGRVSGALSDIPTTAQTVCLYFNASISPGSIAHLTAIRDIRIYSMGWNSANVDTVLLSASDAVWADANHFSYSAPSMQIGGSGGSANAAPGGSSGADTTDPAVTPGNGNSNTDWQWDAGKGAHKALTGKAAVYYLTHLATHTWAITYTA